MSVKILKPGESFPPTSESDSSGLLAIGGSLDVFSLKTAYLNGIFPWYSVGEPLMWWFPDPRMVLFPEELHVSKSMKKLLKSERFSVTCDKEFDSVINLCRDANGRSSETWITEEMINAYIEFHRAGYAHSVEVWENGDLAGGFYGVAIGRMFFGESMFFLRKNASKYGFIKFTQYLRECGFYVIDCQVFTSHLVSLGAVMIPGSDFTLLLARNRSSGLEEKVVFRETI